MFYQQTDHNVLMHSLTSQPHTHTHTPPTAHTHTHRVSTSNALAAHLWPILSELMGEETGWADCQQEGPDRYANASKCIAKIP